MVLTQVSSALIKRSFENGHELKHLELPAWSWLVFLLDLIIFLPLILLLNYTFKHIYPVLAIVEDENPPAYEPVALSDDASNPDGTNKPIGDDNSSHTVTSSFRAINRLLKANGGFRANFRGFFCLVAQGLLTSFLMGIFSAVLGGPFTPIATLLASLTLVQFSTAWVHIVISTTSPLHFWQRLPPFKRTFDATWQAVTLYWFATELTRWVPYVLAVAFNFNLPEIRMGQPMELPENNGAGWKVSVILIATILTSIFVVIPAHVILVRVQASLLPEGEDPILSFDRSFQGTVEPAIVGGRGYVTIRDAWSTFSKAAWRRLIVLYAKIYAVSVALSLVMAVVLVPEFFLLASNSKEKDVSN